MDKDMAIMEMEDQTGPGWRKVQWWLGGTQELELKTPIRVRFPQGQHPHNVMCNILANLLLTNIVINPFVVGFTFLERLLWLLTPSKLRFSC